MIPELSHSDSQPPIDDRLVRFCNAFVASLELNIEQLGVDRFIRAVTSGLAVAGLRLVAYRIEGEGSGGRGPHGV